MRHRKSFQGKRILKLRGIATTVGDIDQAIKDLRKSRVESLTHSFEMTVTDTHPQVHHLTGLKKLGD